MALNQVKATNTERFIPPEDTYIAKLYSIVDLGTHDTGFKKQDKDGKDTTIPIIQNKVLFTFELQDCNLPDGRPAVVSQEFTASLNDRAKIVPVLVALLGGKSEHQDYVSTEGRILSEVLTQVIGKPCQLSVVHVKKKDKTYVNIGSVSALPSSMKSLVTATVNPTLVITDVDNISTADAAKLPDWVKNKQAKRIGVAISIPATKSEQASDDECPF